MKKTTIAIIIAFIFAFILILFLGESTGLTGFIITDKITSFFIRQSISSTGPITVLAIIFAVSVVFLYEVVKK